MQFKKKCLLVILLFLFLLSGCEIDEEKDNNYDDINKKISELIESNDEINKNIEKLESDLNLKIETVDNTYKSLFNKIEIKENENEKLISSLKQQHETDIALIKKEYSSEIEKLKSSFDKNLEEINNLFNDLKNDNETNKKDIQELQAKVDLLEKSKSEKVKSLVSFNYNNDQDNYQIYVENGDKIINPITPLKEGYTFDGWYNNSEKWNFESDTVVTDLILNAHWSINKYSLTIKYNDGITSDLIITQDYGTNISIAYPKMDGYIFKNWSEEIPLTMPAENKTIEANWIEQDVIYEIVNEEVHITGNTGKSKVEILDSYEGYPTRYIDKQAFAKCVELKELTMPNTIISIGDFAFMDCNNLFYINLSSNLSEISNGLFKGCENLSNIILPKNLTTIGSMAFQDCMNLKNIDIPNDVNRIESYAFNNCFNLLNVNIPSNVTCIETGTFKSCLSLKIIIISNNVSSIEYCAFQSCENLEMVDACGSKFNGEITIAEYAFENCFSLKKINLGKIINISELAFMGCNNIEEIFSLGGACIENNGEALIVSETKKLIQGTNQGLIPDGVEIIGQYAFCNNKNIKSIIIPNSVKIIEDHAFEGCTGLEVLFIGDNLESIGSCVFKDCGNLEIIKVSENNPNFDSRNDCNALIETATNQIIRGCKNTIFVEGIEIIGNYAFSKSKLSNVTLPNSIKEIWNYAFSDCYCLQYMILNEGLNYLGSNIFENCIALSEIVIPTTIVYLHTDTFNDFEGLKSITIPASLISIKNNAFKYCIYLNTINYNGTIEQWNKIEKNNLDSCIKTYIVHCTNGDIEKK